MLGMERKSITANDLRINVWVGGDGSPILLLHGYPQTAQMWRKMTPQLLANHTVVCPDLRGYGDTGKPRDGYDKRTMAKDMAHLMSVLGHERYAIAGHDRGGRVAHRLALDWPDNVTHLVVIDIVPTTTVFEKTNKTLATNYWHWFFFQALDLPEIMIARCPEEFLRFLLRSWSSRVDFIEEDVFKEYLRAFTLPGTIRATLEDYRAAAGVDIKDDENDSERKVDCPVLVLWSTVNQTMDLFDVLKTWEDKATNVRGRGIVSGHFIPEEVPNEILGDILGFIE